MLEIINKVFDIKKFPAKLIIVIWITASIAIFAPDGFINRLGIVEFIKEYGKYLGIAFLLCTAIIVLMIATYFIEIIGKKSRISRRKTQIIKAMNSLDFHEKALIREFFIQGKASLQLPFSNDTVQGLEYKGVIYKITEVGFTSIHGLVWSYSITDFANSILTDQNIDLPENPTEEQKQEVYDSRPKWAKDRSRWDNMRM